MTCISTRKLFLSFSLLCSILCLGCVAHAQFPAPTPSITLHLGDGFTNQYNYASPDNAILNQPMSGNVQISGVSSGATAQIQCYVTNYGLIFSETVTYNAYSTFSWTPSYLGATTAGCSLSVSGSTVHQYVQTENMPMTVFDKTPQVAIPQYKVLSLIYAAPGNSSSAGYTTGTTNGTSTSVGSNFSSGTSVTFSAKFVVVSASATFGVTDTNGQTNQTTDTFSNAASISNISNSTAPNTLNHNQDLFLLWLNPVVTVQQTSPTAISYTYSLPSSAKGVMDTVEV